MNAQAPGKVETVTFTTVVPIADADGKPIREGSVLRQIEDGERGVVVRISRPGNQAASPLDQVGDMFVQQRPGSTRVSNQYAKWRHIPHNEQTYEERFLSWLHVPYEHSEFSPSDVSKDEGCAINGIMNLLPDDIVDWDYGPFPDRLEDALRYLVNHLNELKENGPKQS